MKNITRQTNTKFVIDDNFLICFIKEIRSFRTRYHKNPEYIIISSYDYETVLKEMQSLGIIPNWNEERLLSFSNIRIIQSIDFKHGQFDVVGGSL